MLSANCRAETRLRVSKSSSSQVIRIRHVKIEVRDVFDDPNLAWFYRLANTLKVNSRKEVITRELLFKEGEPYDEFLIQESERILRTLGFIRQVSIIAVHDHQFVDVIVSVQDTWTLFPQFSFSSGTGANKQSVGIVEENLAGFGKRIEAIYADDEGRQTLAGVWDDRRLFGSYNRLGLGFFQRSDGFKNVIFLGRPFRSLVDPASWGLSLNVSDLVGRLFEGGSERFIFRQKREFFSAGVTISRGNPKKSLRRYRLGYEYIRDDFTAADSNDFADINLDPSSLNQDPDLLADDRKFAGPFLSFSLVNPDFLSINYIDQFERIRDFNLGTQIRFKGQAAPATLGSLQDTFLFHVSGSQGTRLGTTSFFRGELSFRSRVQARRLQNSILSADLRYYNVLGAKYLSEIYLGRHTLAASLNARHGERLDRDVEFLMGASNGLRGYEGRTFTGDSSLVINLEDRFHLIEEVYRLLSIGGVVFADFGGSSKSGPSDILNDDLYGDVGFGLRLGFPRNSGGNVLRFDVAFPVRSAGDDNQAWEPRFTISTGQIFDAFLPGEKQREISTQSAFAGG